MISGIYVIRNKVNGKRYIGSTNNIKRRWKEHACLLRKGKHDNSHLQRAWDKYGEDNFEFVVILECSVEQLLNFEQKQFETCPEYNLSHIAGKIEFTAEIRKKQSIALKGKVKSKEWREHISIGKTGKTHKGVPHTQEYKDRMSALKKGIPKPPFSEQHRNNLSIASKGKPKKKGRIVSIDTRTKLSKTNTGKPHPHKGHKFSKESINKRTASRKRLREERKNND